MRHRILVAGIAIIVVLAGVGGSVAALTGSKAAPAKVSPPTPKATVASPATAAVTTPISSTPPATVPATVPAPTPISRPAVAPSNKVPTTAAAGPTTTLAPAIGAPGGSRFGPSGLPTS